MEQQPKPPPKHRAAKRLALSAAAGAALGFICHALPPQWQLPCGVLVKLVVLVFGSGS